MERKLESCCSSARAKRDNGLVESVRLENRRKPPRCIANSAGRSVRHLNGRTHAVRIECSARSKGHAPRLRDRDNMLFSFRSLSSGISFSTLALGCFRRAEGALFCTYAVVSADALARVARLSLAAFDKCRGTGMRSALAGISESLRNFSTSHTRIRTSFHPSR
jgi:hypothetical protein